MIPWQTLGEAKIPGEASPLVLLQHDEEFVIRIGTRALMSSTEHGSEEALAELACARLADRPDARVGAALKHLPVTARVTVAELIPAVVEWNRGPLAHLAGNPLADPRVVVQVGDVTGTIRSGRAAFDAILLDVDNGPQGLTRATNDRLYSGSGLQVAFAALRDGGVFGVWSVEPDPAFTKRLAQAGFQVEEEVVRARVSKGGRHTLWLATRKAPAEMVMRPAR